MTLEKHVLKAIKDYKEGDLESALMNACIAIEGTARNLYEKDKASRNDYKKCIRDYYWIIEPMLGGGLNQFETLFTNLNIDNESAGTIEKPDLADVVYHIFRCNLAHSKSVPLNYELLPSEDGRSRWEIGGDILKMPDRVIWALLAVSVFSKANSGIQTKGDYWLSWGSESLGLGTKKFVIKDWWGKEDDFRLFLSKKNPNPTKIEIEGLDNLRPAR